MKTYKEAIEYLRGMSIILNDVALEMAIKTIAYIYDVNVKEIMSQLAVRG